MGCRRGKAVAGAAGGLRAVDPVPDRGRHRAARPVAVVGAGERRGVERGRRPVRLRERSPGELERLGDVGEVGRGRRGTRCRRAGRGPSRRRGGAGGRRRRARWWRRCRTCRPAAPGRWRPGGGPGHRGSRCIRPVPTISTAPFTCLPPATSMLPSGRTVAEWQSDAAGERRAHARVGRGRRQAVAHPACGLGAVDPVPHRRRQEPRSHRGAVAVVGAGERGAVPGRGSRRPNGRAGPR